MILVTGASGHLGNVLVRELLARNSRARELRLRVLLLPGDAAPALAGLDVERVAGDVLDPASLRPAFAGVERVYHLAGIISILPGATRLMQRVNIEGARNVARAAREAGARMIHTASIHAFQRLPHGYVQDEQTPLALENPAGDYDYTKAAGMRAVQEEVTAGLDAVIACPTGVIGPHDYQRSEMGVTLAGFTRRRLHLLLAGAYDFVDVRDVVNGLLLAAEKGRRGEAYILSGALISLVRLKELTQAAAKVRSPHLLLPFPLALAFARLMQHVYRITGTVPQFTPYSLRTVHDNAVFSCAKAQRELGYTVRPIHETIADTLAWRRAMQLD